MSIPRATLVALAATLPVVMSGCSILFTEGPPTGHAQMDYFPCTESKAAPILDVIFAAGGLVGAATAEDDLYFSKGEQVALGLGQALVLGISSSVGFNRVNRCRAARLELATRNRPPSSDTTEASQPHGRIEWPTYAPPTLEPRLPLGVSLRR